MNNNQYAIALFEIAKEQNKITVYKEEFEAFVELLDTNEDFKKTFFTPNIKIEDKKEILKKSLIGFEEAFIFFLFVVLDNNRETLIDDIFASFINMYNEEMKIKVVTIISVNELEEKEYDSLKDALEKHFKGYKVVINNKIDSSLIGGYHILCNGVSINLSIQNKINSLKEGL